MKFIEYLILVSFGVLLNAKFNTSTSLSWWIVFSPLLFWLGNIIFSSVLEWWRERQTYRNTPTWLR